MLALFEKTWVLWWMLAVLMSRPGFTCSPQLLPGILRIPQARKRRIHHARSVGFQNVRCPEGFGVNKFV